MAKCPSDKLKACIANFDVPVQREGESVDAYQKRFKKFIDSMSDIEIFNYISACLNYGCEGGVENENSN